MDSGFFSEHNAQQLEENEIEPYIACGRQSHNLTLEERLAPVPAPPENPDAHREADRARDRGDEASLENRSW